MNVTAIALPAIQFSADADLDSVGTVLTRLTGFAFDVTLSDGSVVNGVLEAVEYLTNGRIMLDLKDEQDNRFLLDLSRVMKIVYC